MASEDFIAGCQRGVGKEGSNVSATGRAALNAPARVGLRGGNEAWHRPPAGAGDQPGGCGKLREEGSKWCICGKCAAGGRALGELVASPWASASACGGGRGANFFVLERSGAASGAGMGGGHNPRWQFRWRLLQHRNLCGRGHLGLPSRARGSGSKQASGGYG